MEGLVVYNLRTIGNSLCDMPAGTKFTIVDKSSGLSLKSEPCECRGFSVFIRKVEPSLVCDEEEAYYKGFHDTPPVPEGIRRSADGISARSNC